MPDTFNNIFLTTENLAFSLPLILVCTTYVYFKYVPLHIGLPIIGGIVLLAQIRNQIKKQREKKLVKLDEGTIQKLIGELELESDKDSSNNAAAAQKAKNKVQARLAQERKAESRKASEGKKGKKAIEDDDDDIPDNLAVFAKAASAKQKKSS